MIYLIYLLISTRKYGMFGNLLKKKHVNRRNGTVEVYREAIKRSDHNSGKVSRAVLEN